MIVKPLGILNSTATFDVVAGPPLITWTIQRNWSPGDRVPVPFKFKTVTSRSALALGVTIAVAELLAVFGSGALLSRTLAVMSYGPLAFTLP